MGFFLPHGRCRRGDGQAGLSIEILRKIVPSGIPGGTFRFGLAHMTNQIAITLGAIILIGLGLDWFFGDWAATLFLGRKLADLIEWMAFWR